MKPLTNHLLAKIASEHDYLAIRLNNGIVVGVNCKAARFANYDEQRFTRCVSFRPISFMEYITIKIPFIR